DIQGNHIWTRYYYPINHNEGSHDFLTMPNIIVTKDGGVIISAGTNNYVKYGLVRNLFIRFDSIGNIKWQKTYKRNENDTYIEGSWIANGENDSTYYFITRTATKPASPWGSNPINSLLLYGKLNYNGDTLWTKQFADSGALDGYKETTPLKIRKYKNKLYLLASVYYDSYFHSTLIITDSVGKVLSYREYYPKQLTYYYDLYDVEISESRIVLCGSQKFSPPLHFDSWVISTDSLGCEVTGCESADIKWQTHVGINTLNKQLVDVLLYPNPTTNYVNVTAINSSITLYNNVGVQLMQTNTIQASTTLDLTPHGSGIYYVQVTNNNETQTFKVIKE
ncbi:MAG: T9SS type A sorting domain-containing protein, partial [Bacteroidia bacterium]